MRQSSVLSACLAINTASLLFQIIVYVNSGYGHAGMTIYTLIVILFNAQAWELSSKMEDIESLLKAINHIRSQNGK